MKQETLKKFAELAKRDTKKFAELIVEYIDPGHFVEDVVSLMLEPRTYKPGDLLVAKVRKGVKQVRTWVPGQQTFATELVVEDRVNVNLDNAYIHVTASLWELKSGELGTVEDIRRQMELSLKDYFAGKVFTALSTIWNAANTPDNYATVATKIDAATLRAAINRINEVAGRVRGVFGTRKALTPITEFGNFVVDGSNVWGVPSNIEEIMRTGWLGRWYGAPIVALEQSYTDIADYQPMIPDNYILVIGEQAGKFIRYGDPIVHEWEDVRELPPRWNLRIAQQFGMIVDNAQAVYVIEIV